MLERLSLEEALLRHDDRNWAVVGTHEVGVDHKYLSPQAVRLPDYISSSSSMHPDCLIVMGIGGKPEHLLNIDRVREDQVLVCKRFSGGGTVVMDTNSLWTTVIGRKDWNPPGSPIRFVPSTPPVTRRLEFDWDELVVSAQQYRPDLIEGTLLLETDVQRVIRANNNALPQVNALASYQFRGLGGRDAAHQPRIWS